MFQLTIRKTMIISLAVILLVFTGLLSIMVNQELKNLKTLKQIAEISNIIATFNKGTIELSLERSLTQVSLNLDPPILPQIKDMLDSQREKSDALFAETRALLEDSKNIEDKESLMRAFHDNLREMENLRNMADRQMALPLVSRTVREVKNLPEEIKAVVLDLNGISVWLNGMMDDAPKDVGALNSIISNAWTVREYGGRERTLYAIATARGEPIKRMDLAYMFQNHGKVIQAENAIEFLAASVDLGPEVNESIEKVKTTYFSQYNNLRETLIRESVTGEYSVDFQTLFTESEEALQTAISLLHTAVTANKEFISTYIGKAYQKLFIEMMIALLITAIIGFITWFIMVRVVRSLTGMTDAMGRLANNELDTEVPEADRKDEIGDMAKALETFKVNGKERERLEAEQKAAQQKQMERAEEVSTEVAQFEEAIAEIATKLNDSAQNLQVMASELSSAMEKTDAQSSSVAAAALEASTNVQTVASAAEEMAMSVQEISRNVSDTANTARSCSTAAENSQQKLDMLQTAVNDIGAIIESINDVAEQTNLLALNATIEAARAGDAGKGFAVVANEVKSLAGQTHKMTEEITNKVDEIQNSASETIAAVNDILKQIQSVTDQTNSVASAVEEQNVTTTEISRNVQEAANGTSEVSENIQGIQQAANESAQSTRELEESANGLANQAAVLRKSVDEFLAAVRD